MATVSFVGRFFAVTSGRGDSARVAIGGPSAGIVFLDDATHDSAMDGEAIQVREVSIHFERPEEADLLGSFEHSGYVSLALEDLFLGH